MVRATMMMATVALVPLLAVVAGCGDDDNGSPATMLEVELDEWKVIPKPESANAGRIEFVATNTGKTPHELVIIRTDTSPDKLPVVRGKVDEGKAARRSAR